MRQTIPNTSSSSAAMMITGELLSELHQELKWLTVFHPQHGLIACVAT